MPDTSTPIPGWHSAPLPDADLSATDIAELDWHVTNCGDDCEMRQWMLARTDQPDTDR
ncbi:hypothetical protein ACFRAQ_34470 [Nocardia sp. NPDC056611]|uniref:hypothetical protein n=1 Tax=Nocardia sp. NPDC056611 TaxID=3345877 RepID=UPI00366E7FAF